MIGHQQDGAQVRLVSLTCRDERVEIDGLIARQVLEPLAIRLEASHAVVPRLRVGRRGLRPVVVRPRHRVLVVRVQAEVEHIELRKAHVLNQLPDGIRDTWRQCPPLVRRQAVDGLVEPNVRLFPVEDARELQAKGI